MSSNLSSHSALDVQNALRRNALLQPLGNCLRRNSDSQCESSLASKDVDNSDQWMVKHDANVHRQLMFVNWDLIAPSCGHPHNQLMIDTPQPESYQTFVEWLTAFCEYYGSQRAAATAAGVSPQAMTKWLAGGNIKALRLRELATNAKVDYSKLLLLFNRQPTSPDVIPESRFTTSTELGAIVGRKWEALYEPAKSQMLGLIETLLALQNPRQREYGLKQKALAKQREKSSKRPEKT